jgi:hypothetical protein
MLEHAELVVYLRPTRNQDERARNVAQQPAEVLQLGFEQQAGVGGKEMSDSFGRRVRAMGRAKGVVDVEIAAVRQLARERVVVLRLAWIKARVLEHVNAFVKQQLVQPVLHGRHRILRAIRLRLRPTEVRADADLPRGAIEQ